MLIFSTEAVRVLASICHSSNSRKTAAYWRHGSSALERNKSKLVQDKTL